MKKLMLALALILSLLVCCAEEEDSTIIAAFDGGYVYFDEVFEDYETAAAVYAALYGDDEGTRGDIITQLQMRLVNDVIMDKLLDIYAASLSTPLITADDMREIEALALRDYQLLYEESLPMYLADEELTEEEARNELAGDLLEAGLSYDMYLEQYTKEFKTRAALASLAGEVKVTTSQVNERYQTRLANDTAYFSQNPEDYPYAYFYSDETVLYIPEGMKQIRVWFVDMTPEEMSSRLATNNMKDILKFAVPAENLYGVAGGSEGAPIYPGCAMFDDAIMEAAFRLQKPGELSDPLRVETGYEIVELIGNIKSGTVAQKTVYTEIYNNLLSELQMMKGREKLEQMLAAANVRYYLYRLG